MAPVVSCFWFGLLILIPGTAADQKNTPLAKPKVDTDAFRLERIDGRYVLTCADSTCRLEVPRSWLVPEEAGKEGEYSYTASTTYSRTLHSFLIGRGLVAIHASSFDSMESGSAGAASGRDVFLVFDPLKMQLFQGLTDLGLTKTRIRSSGYFDAVSAHFILSDVNSDDMIDLGVIFEEIKGGKYRQYLVRWYVFNEVSWTHQRQYDGRLGTPKHYRELPLIELDSLTVDFVASILWKTRDCRYWAAHPIEPRFIPEYRRRAIEREKREAQR